MTSIATIFILIIWPLGYFLYAISSVTTSFVVSGLVLMIWPLWQIRRSGITFLFSLPWTA
jgi:hypothetical protein